MSIISFSVHPTHCPHSRTWINSLNLHNSMKEVLFYYSHFIVDKTMAERDWLNYLNSGSWYCRGWDSIQGNWVLGSVLLIPMFDYFHGGICSPMLWSKKGFLKQKVISWELLIQQWHYLHINGVTPTVWQGSTPGYLNPNIIFFLLHP